MAQNQLFILKLGGPTEWEKLDSAEDELSIINLMIEIFMIIN